MNQFQLAADEARQRKRHEVALALLVKWWPELARMLSEGTPETGPAFTAAIASCWKIADLFLAAGEK